MNFTANALLATGASPLMTFFKEELEEMVGVAAALTVNIGCLDALSNFEPETAARELRDIADSKLLK